MIAYLLFRDPNLLRLSLFARTGSAAALPQSGVVDKATEHTFLVADRQVARAIESLLVPLHMDRIDQGIQAALAHILIKFPLARRAGRELGDVHDLRAVHPWLRRPFDRAANQSFIFLIAFVSFISNV